MITTNLCRFRKRGTTAIGFLSLAAVLAVAMTGTCDAQLSGEEGGLQHREQFVPLEELESVLSQDGRGVMLPRGQFRELLQRAESQRSTPNPLPVSVTDCEVRISPMLSRVGIEMLFGVNQLDPGWQLVEIPIGNLSLEEAEFNGVPAVLRRSDDDFSLLRVAVNSVGENSLRLRLTAPLTQAGSDRLTAIRLPGLPSVSLQVECPAGESLQVDGRRTVRPATADTAAVYTIAAGGRKEVSLRWGSEDRSVDSQQLLFLYTAARLQFGNSVVRWNSETQVSVFGTRINQVTALVSPNFEVTAVESTGLESWTLSDSSTSPGRTELLLTWRQPFSGDRSVQISGVTLGQAASGEAGDSEIRVPAVVFPEATSHTGRLILQQESGLRLNTTAAGGVRAISAAESGETVEHRVFEFWDQTYRLSAGLRPRDRELYAEIVTDLTLGEDEGVLSTQITLEALNEPLFELPVELPEGWQLQTVTSGDQSVSWKAGAREQDLVLTLPTPLESGQVTSLSISLQRPLEDPVEERQLALPAISLPGVITAGGRYRISAEEDLEVTPLELTGLTAVAGSAGVQEFRRDGEVAGGVISIVRGRVQLTTRSVIRVSADPNELQVSAELTVDVLQGTTRTLDLNLSEEFGDDVRFQILRYGVVAGDQSGREIRPVGIAEQIFGDPVDGFRPVQLRLDRRFFGSLTLRVISRRPRETGGELPAPVLQLQAAVRQHGLLVYEAHPEQLLSADRELVQRSGLQPADPGLVEAPAADSGRRLALVWRFVRPAYELSVNETRFDVTGVPTAVCEQLTSECSLSGTGQIQQSVIADLELSGVQTLRFRLPENSFLWSTVLDGEPTEVRREESDYLVSLKTSAGSTSHRLTVLFETDSDEQRVTNERRPVQMFIDGGGDQPAVVDVLRQTWQVHYSPETMIVAAVGPFSVDGELDRAGWSAALLELRWPEVADWQKLAIPICLYCAVVYVLSVLLVRRRWKLLTTLVSVCGLFYLTSNTLRVESRAPSSWGFQTDSSAEIMDFESFNTAATAAPTAASDDFVESPQSETRGAEMLFGRSEEAEADFGDRQMDQPTDAPGSPMALGLIESNGIMGGVGGGGGLGGFGGGPGMLPPGAAGEPPGQAVQGDADGLAIANGPFGGRAAGQAVPSPASGAVSDDIALSQFGEMGGEGISGRRRKSGSARLSVSVDLDVPDDFQRLEFVSTADNSGAPAVLQLQTMTRQQLVWLRYLVTAALLVPIWWLRRRRLVQNISFLISVLLLAFASLPFAAGRWTVVIDGVLTAVSVGMLLLLIRSCRTGCCTGWCPLSLWQRFRRLRQAALILLGVTAASQSVAQETVDPQIPTGNPGVVVPYDSDRPALSSDRVYVDFDEYLRLYRAAHPGELPDGVDPLQPESRVVAMRLRANQLKEVNAGQQLMSLTARFAVWSSREDAHEVLLPLGAIAVGEVQVDGKPGSLTVRKSPPVPRQQAQQQEEQQQKMVNRTAPRQDEQWLVLISGKGLHEVDLRLEVPVTTSGGPGRCDIPLRQPSAGYFEWTLPKPGLDLIVNGRTDSFQRDGDRVRIAIDGLSTLRLQWLPRANRTAADSNWTAETNQVFCVESSGIRLRQQFDLTVRQGDISELETTLPEGWLIRSVEGKDLAGWGIQQVNDERILQIRFRRAVDDNTSVLLEQFTDLPADDRLSNFSLPIAQIRGAGRVTGVVSLRAGDEFQVRTLKQSGVSQQNPEEVEDPAGEQLPGRRMLAWRYTRQPAAITVRVTPTPDIRLVEAWHAVRVEQQRRLWTTRFRLRLTGTPRTRLEVKLTDHFLPLDVSATGLRDWYLSESVESTSDSIRVLNLQLEDASTGMVEIVLQGRTEGTAVAAELELTPPIMLDATRADSRLAVWLDGTNESGEPESGSDWQRIPADSVAGVYRELTTEVPAIVLRSDALTPGSVRIPLRPAISSVIGESVTVTTVTPTSLEQMLALKWLISRAPADRFSVDLPTELADTMKFDVPGQRRVTRTQADAGRSRVVFELQQPVEGQFFVLGTVSQALPEDGVFGNSAPVFTAADQATLTLSAQSHYEVVVNQSNALLKSDAEAELPAVDADQISTRIPASLLEQAVRIVPLDVQTGTWSIEIPEQQQVSPTVISLATHETNIAEDGSWRSTHRLLVTNESRQFLPVTFPTGSRLLYCRIEGRPVRVVSDSANERQLIPIPQNGLSAAGFELEFAISGEIEELSQAIDQRLGRWQIAIPVPEFPEYRDDSATGVSISRNRWMIRLPDKWRAVLLDDPRFTNVVEATQESLEDAEVLSEVEQALQLAGRAGSSELSTGKQSYLSSGTGLQGVLRRLQTIRGNGAEVETKRNEALQLMNRLDAQLQGQNQGLIEGNSYLYQQDAQSNILVTEQRDLFFMDNGRAATRSQSELEEDATRQSSGMEFRFERQLKEREVQDEAAKAKSAARVEKQIDALQRRGLARDKDANNAVEQLGRDFRGRQLLQKNAISDLKRQQAPQRLMESLDIAEPAPPPLPKSESSSMENEQLAARAAMPQAPEEQLFEGRAELGDAAEQSGGQAASATGVLSLSFEIPAEGKRLDFIRVGGNPLLTLQVESAETERFWPGAAWAVICLLTLFLVRRVSNAGSVSGGMRNAGLALLTGSAGVAVLNPGHMQQTGVLLAAAAVLLIAVGVVAGSFQRVEG